MNIYTKDEYIDNYRFSINQFEKYTRSQLKQIAQLFDVDLVKLNKRMLIEKIRQKIEQHMIGKLSQELGEYLEPISYGY